MEPADDDVSTKLILWQPYRRLYADLTTVAIDNSASVCAVQEVTKQISYAE